MSEEEVKRSKSLPKKTVSEELEIAEKRAEIDAITRVAALVRDVQDEIARLSKKFAALEEENRAMIRAVENLVEEMQEQGDSAALDGIESAETALMIEQQKTQNELISAGITALAGLLAPKKTVD
jgi:predicted nuclease with TOPRIM domain